MKKFETGKFEDLADVFCSLMGGRPDNIREIEIFIKDSPLKELLYASDIERILKYDGFFAEEIVDAVYALLPIKFKLNQNKSIILTPQEFRKLNRAVITRPAAHSVDVDFKKACGVFFSLFPKKVQTVIKAIKYLQSVNESNKIVSPSEKMSSGTQVKRELHVLQNKKSYYSEKREKQIRDENGLPKIVQRRMEKVEENKKPSIQEQEKAQQINTSDKENKKNQQRGKIEQELKQNNAKPARKKAGRVYYLTKVKDWDR